MTRRRNSRSSPAAYSPPVDRLLALGEAPARAEEWPEYPALGLEPEHVPELIRMAVDPRLHHASGDAPEVWAPIHAWRALGQLRAEAAIEPLSRLLHEQTESDWVSEELPRVFGMIGPAAVPALARYLANPGRSYESRVLAGDCLVRIGQDHPSARDQVVAVHLDQLESFERNPRLFNAMLIADLLDLRATEAAPLIERIYAEDQVALSVCGDWEEVQVELGLLSERQTPAPRYDHLAELDYVVPKARVETRPEGSKRAEKAKAKRKLAKQSRKQNRRRR